MKRLCALALILLSLTRASANVQSHDALIEHGQTGQSDPARSKAVDRRASSITGRIVGDSSQPISNAVVRVTEVGKLRPNFRTTSTDGEGRFRVEDLTRGLYSVIPDAPGYIAEDEDLRQKPYRPGDDVTFTLVKGGVITGTVTNSAGEPKVALRIRAMRVRDKDGRTITNRFVNETQTDDRGIYRIYGMQTGSYLIQASDQEPFSPRGITNDEVPTYYPSSTLDTATPVSVRPGEELTGIDIRYRGEQGHAVSGALSSAALSSAVSQDSTSRGVYLVLMHDPGNTEESQTFAGMSPKDRSFAFYGVPDGDYNLYARGNSNEKGETIGSARVRVKVKGADVTGLEIKLAPLGSIAGSVKVEPLSPADQKSKCDSKQRSLLNEILITARRDEKEGKNSLLTEYWSRYQIVPMDKGEFTIINIEPGSYRLEYDLPSEQLYARSVTLPSPAPARPAVDAARDSLTIKSGATLGGLSITIAEGAATVKGRIVAASEGARLPDRLRAHLVPAEKESANDVLRFAEAIALSDGSFSFSNVAPGRYWIIARAILDDEPSAKPRPVAWDSQARATLRQAAEAANVSLELQVCQRISDYSLKYAPPAASKPATKKSE